MKKILAVATLLSIGTSVHAGAVNTNLFCNPNNTERSPAAVEQLMRPMDRSCYPSMPFNSCTGKNVGADCFDGNGFGTCEVVKKDRFGNLMCGCI